MKKKGREGKRKKGKRIVPQYVTDRQTGHNNTCKNDNSKTNNTLRYNVDTILYNTTSKIEHKETKYININQVAIHFTQDLSNIAISLRDKGFVTQALTQRNITRKALGCYIQDQIY